MGAGTTVWDDASAQAAAIRAGHVAATELVDAYLARIDRLDPVLRTYVTVDADSARRQAAAVDEAVAAGDASGLPPHAGVTISVKDNVDVAGLPTTHSCKVLAGNVAEVDAPVVRRLRAAGFVVLGKSNLPEFCTTFTSSELNGVCRNPWDPERSPSGSSGGAGAGLAAGLCAVAHGTDGAGSVRTPASYCGVVGIKPSRGLIGFGPLEEVAYYGTSVHGVLSRSVRDTAAVLDVMAGAGLDGPSWSARPTVPLAEAMGRDPGRRRVAVCTTYPVGDVDLECVRAVGEVADALAELGHDVVEAAPDWMAMLAVAAGPMSVPGPAALVGLDQLDQVEPRNRPLVESDARLTVLDHSRWAQSVRLASAGYLGFWEEHDVLLTPTSGMLPPSVDWAPWDQSPEDHMATFANYANFAHPANLSGQPAISLPAAWSSTGLPIGLQLTGRVLDEALLLQLSAQLEQARPWRDRRPPDPA